MRTFRLANIKDTLNILKFANLNWGSEHPILNYTEWFVYYYIDMTIGVPRFAICEEDNVIAAICGYILAAEDSDSGIWMSFLVADKKRPGAGMELIAHLSELTGADRVACINIKKNTIPMYRFLGWHTGQLDFYYRLADKEQYKIAQIQKKNIPESTINVPFSYKKIDGGFLQGNNLELGETYPKKDISYVIKRYFQCPFYKYDVWQVTWTRTKKLLLVTRTMCVEGVSILHVVDVIGDLKLISWCGSFFQFLIEQAGAEYIDCYCTGVPTAYFEDAGMVKRLEEDDENIIPTRLELPIQKINVDVYYCTNRVEDFVAFRGDGDFDRPFMPNTNNSENVAMEQQRSRLARGGGGKA